MNSSPQHPSCYEARDRLLDGSEALIRAIHPDDKAALRAGFHRLSAESVYHRFFRRKRDLSKQELVHFTEVDFTNHVALGVAVVEDLATFPVGVGRYIVCRREPVPAAEVAFAVDDAFQGIGIATTLLRHLIKIGQAGGIAEFHASVLPDNPRMLAVFSRCGLPQTTRLEAGVVEVTLSLG